VRAIRYRDGQVWLDASSPAPEPGPGEVLLRVACAGVGAPELSVCRGDVAFEGVLGHELVGVVSAFGEGCRDRERWAGARVVASPDVVCGRCDLCRAGLSAHCRERQVIGLAGRDGCLAERMVVPERNLVALPEAVEDEDGVFAIGAALALHAAQVIRIEGKAYVTVLGDDVTALLCAQVMQRLNASVRVIGSRPAALRVWQQWGLRHRRAGEAGLRQDQDVVVVCALDRDSLATASGMVRPRGKVMLVDATGLGVSGEASLAPVIGHELEVLGVRGGSVEDGVGAIARGEVTVAGLMTKRMKLDDGVGVLRAAQDALKVCASV